MAEFSSTDAEEIKKLVTEIQKNAFKGEELPIMPTLVEKDNVVSRIQSYFNQQHKRISRETARIVADYVIGLGPLQPFYEDPSVAEVMLHNGYIRVEKNGEVSDANIKVSDEDAMRILKNLATLTNAKFGTGRPILSTYIPRSFNRVLGMIPPVTTKPQINIRKHLSDVYTIKDLENRGMLDARITAFLEEMLKVKANILITGIGSSGKTTLVDALLQNISENSVVAIVEDVRELHPNKKNIISMSAVHKTRNDSQEPEELVDVSTLINMVGTRIHAHRVILGEVRTGEEAKQFLNTIGIGSDGVITTIHSSTPQGAVERLESLTLDVSKNFSESAMKTRIGENLDIIVQLAMIRDKFRIVDSVMVLSVEKGRYQFTSVFKTDIKDVNDLSLTKEFKLSVNLLQDLPEKIQARLRRYYGEKWDEYTPLKSIFNKGGKA